MRRLRTAATTTTATGSPTAVVSNCSHGENGVQQDWGWQGEVAGMTTTGQGNGNEDDDDDYEGTTTSTHPG